ncbi:zinc ribbon domain-containing protein [Thermotoga sp. KOL6]|uniref:FmdB family zinc ribbon protein n=1 Tax=Thermotoga sp. KOL6 TaxID=126741 RepID=UPI000C77DF6C|nr:zinc ribbon domain-containing protein [Thermotoga sp. KOL6]PLV59904.1 transcriptional regulator [Thermotoga sp. KOL6]
MPTYTFKCKNCGEVYTIFTFYSKIGEAKCPKCNSKEKERVYKKVPFTVQGGTSSSSCGGNCGGCSGCS